MDAVIAKLVDIFILSGTMGSYSMLGVVLMIFIYFKYLKPFLLEFYKVRDFLTEEFKAENEIKGLIENMKTTLEEVKNSVQGYGKDIRRDIEAVNAESVIKMSKEIDDLELLVKDVLRTIETHGTIETEKFNQLLMELTKLNVRFEMNQQVANLRGLK